MIFYRFTSVDHRRRWRQFGGTWNDIGSLYGFYSLIELLSFKVCLLVQVTFSGKERNSAPIPSAVIFTILYSFLSDNKPQLKVFVSPGMVSTMICPATCRSA
jgi:hypothetical protein